MINVENSNLEKTTQAHNNIGLLEDLLTIRTKLRDTLDIYEKIANDSLPIQLSNQVTVTVKEVMGLPSYKYALKYILGEDGLGKLLTVFSMYRDFKTRVINSDDCNSITYGLESLYEKVEFLDMNLQRNINSYFRAIPQSFTVTNPEEIKNVITAHVTFLKDASFKIDGLCESLKDDIAYQEVVDKLSKIKEELVFNAHDSVESDKVSFMMDDCLEKVRKIGEFLEQLELVNLVRIFDEFITIVK